MGFATIKPISVSTNSLLKADFSMIGETVFLPEAKRTPAAGAAEKGGYIIEDCEGNWVEITE